MKLLSSLLAIAAITSYTMAAPAEDVKDAKEGTEAADKADANHWAWCAPKFTCDTYSDFNDGGCYSQPDCRAKARDGDTIRSFGCGASFYPRSCWVYTN